MKLQSIYNEYVNLKFNRALPPEAIAPYAYCTLEDDSIELFVAGQPEAESFVQWADELQPPDPGYTTNPNWIPVLSGSFPALDIYDEQILYYLLYTINSTTAIVPVNPYNSMNDFMKNYSFLQLSRVTHVTRLSDEQREQLRDFFFFFYLYTHPVNGETLEAFSFSGPKLLHTKTSIQIADYFSVYHDYYSGQHDQLKQVTPGLLQQEQGDEQKHANQEQTEPADQEGHNQIKPEPPRQVDQGGQELAKRELSEQLAPEQNNDEMAWLTSHPIETYKNLTLEMLQSIEGTAAPLLLPMEDGWEDALRLINNVDNLLELYSNKPSALFEMMKNCAAATANPYQVYIYRSLLQHYACYILYFRFDELHALVDYFKDTPSLCKVIVSHIFTDAIFIQKMMRQQQIDLSEYENVTQFFNEQARQMYL